MYGCLIILHTFQLSEQPFPTLVWIIKVPLYNSTEYINAVAQVVKSLEDSRCLFPCMLLFQWLQVS